MKTWTCILSLAVLALTTIGTQAFAFEVVGPARVIYVENGWNGEGLVVHLNLGTAGCGASTNDFAVDVNHPAYKQIVALALTAYSMSADVQLVVEPGVCIFGGRTKILSIRLVK